MDEWIRVARDDEYEAYAAFRNAMYPDQPTTGEMMRASEERAPAHAEMERYLLRREGRFVGSGLVMRAYWFEAPELFVADAHPGDLEAGCFGLIHARMEARAAEKGAGRLRSMVSSTAVECLAVLESRGYSEAERFPVTSVDVREFDSTPFVPAVQAVEASGIRIVPLEEYMAAHPDDWRHAVWRFDMDVSRDMPFQEEWAEIPFDSYMGQFVDVPTFDPSLHFTALDGEALVGITMLLLIPGNSELLGTGLTGVARGYRRRGLATALKVRALEAARRRGYRRIVTENEETNPMLELNRALGYRRVYDEVILAKTL